MRVLLMSHWFPPVVSGSSFYAQSLAQALRLRGHEVLVVTLDWGEDYASDSGLGFPVHRLPVVRIPQLPIFYNLRLMGFAFTPQNRKRLNGLIRQSRPEIIHIVNHIFDTNFLAVQAARSAGLPVVGSITTPVQHQNEWIQRLYHLADKFLLGRWGVQNWDGIVSLDQTVHTYVGRVYGPEAQKKSVVIPFGVRLESLCLYEDPLPIRSERPQILMVGHIHPFRNPTQLVRAMRHVLKEIPQARLVLAGRMDLQEPLRVSRELGLTRNQVEFLGETEHAQAIQLMKSSHVYATWVTGPYPSLGTAPMEAMLCETPVVSDLPENLFGENGLKNGVNIVLVNSKDPESIARHLVRLLKNEDLRKKIGAGGRRFVLEFLNWDRIAKQMERFYETFCPEKQKAELVSR